MNAHYIIDLSAAGGAGAGRKSISEYMIFTPVAGSLPRAPGAEGVLVGFADVGTDGAGSRRSAVKGDFRRR